MNRNYTLGLALIALLGLAGCSRTFEFSPFSGDIADGHTDLTTANNLDRLRQEESGSQRGRDIKIALLSDTHYWNEELHEAIDRINADPAVTFTVFCGDYSDQGLEQEYLDFYREVKRLKKPFFTVTGNHDYLAGANRIYRTMFGPENYAFDYGGHRFIFFDDVFWEKNGSPDYAWLESQLAQEDATPVVFAHLPPFSDQFTEQEAAQYRALMARYRVPASIHGHNHRYQLVKEPAESTTYLVVASAEKREYCTLTFDSARRPVISRIQLP